MLGFRIGSGARKFTREVGIIVLGVLIALGIGELADALRWRARTATSNAAVDGELARAAGVLDERALIQPCLDRRLDEVDRVIRRARSSNSLPNIRSIGRPPFRPLATAAWDEAVGSGTLLHLNAERRTMLSINYAVLRGYPDAVTQEQGLWATLHILEDAPGPVSDNVLTEAAVDVARLRYLSWLNGVNAVQVRDILSANRIVPDYATIFDRKASRGEVIAVIRAKPICRSMTADPIR